MKRFVVYDENALCIIDLKENNPLWNAQVVATNIIKGSNLRSGDITAIAANGRTPDYRIRPATRKDFETFRVSIQGYDNDPTFEPITDVNQYIVRKCLYIKGKANTRYSELSLSDVNKGKTHRTIGGDKGDLLYTGFTLEGESTELDNPILRTTLDLSLDQVDDLAQEILDNAFQSVGFECLYHD